LGAVWLAERHRRSAEEEARRRSLVNRHLFQLQEAADTLWHRLANVRHRGGRYVMTDEYFSQSTLYALGRVLAVERILGLEGVYPELAALDPNLSRFLKDHVIDSRLDGTKFYKYDRLTLAETLIEGEEDRFRASTYVEFRRRYDDPSLGVRTWLAPALESLVRLDDDVIDALLTDLAAIAERLEAETQLQSSIRASTGP